MDRRSPDHGPFSMVVLMPEGFGSPAPFRADEALVALKRKLRDMKLHERGGREFLRGPHSVVQLDLEGSAIVAKLARRPALTTEWTSHRLASALDARKFTDTLQLQLKRWAEDD
jgi:hypothetical protein